jgi:hypothetical protein
MIHGSYSPAVVEEPREEGWKGTMKAIQAGQLTADELLRRYCKLVYDLHGSYEETAARIGLDWRTVKKKLSGD